MAHFAQLDKDNKVIQVIVIDNDKTHDENGVEQESLGIAYCKELFGADTKWVQTSYNNSMRVRHAGIGFTYDSKLDAFIPPKPHKAFVFDETILAWKAPKSEPEFDYITHRCYWSDEVDDWVIEERKTPLTVETPAE